MNLSEQLNSPNMKHWMKWPISWESTKINIPLQLSTQVFRKKHDTILPSHGEQLLFATAAGPDAWKTARPDCENQRTSQQKNHRFSPVVMYVLIRTQRATDTNQVSMDLVLYPCTRKHECRNLFLRGKDVMKEQNQTMAVCGQCLIGSWIVYLYARPWLTMFHSLPDYAQASDASFHVFGSSIPIFCASLQCCLQISTLHDLFCVWMETKMALAN